MASTANGASDTCKTSASGLRRRHGTHGDVAANAGASRSEACRRDHPLPAWAHTPGRSATRRPCHERRSAKSAHRPERSFSKACRVVTRRIPGAAVPSSRLRPAARETPGRRAARSTETGAIQYCIMLLVPRAATRAGCCPDREGSRRNRRRHRVQASMFLAEWPRGAPR